MREWLDPARMPSWWYVISAFLAGVVVALIIEVLERST